MKKIFLDTNVVVDLLSKRDPFYKDAVKIFTLAYNKKVTLFVSPLTYATASYLLRKQGNNQVRMLLRNFRQLSKVAIANELVVDNALASSFDDFEDALQYYSALTQKVDVIVTRNVSDFMQASIPVLTPEEFLNQC